LTVKANGSNAVVFSGCLLGLLAGEASGGIFLEVAQCPPHNFANEPGYDGILARME
jgi:hypothetical protein